MRECNCHIDSEAGIKQVVCWRRYQRFENVNALLSISLEKCTFVWLQISYSNFKLTNISAVGSFKLFESIYLQKCFLVDKMYFDLK